MTSQVNQKYIHSFVICAFQESKFLEESIKSCIDQFSVKQNKSTIILYTSTPNNYIKLLADKYKIDYFSGDGGNIGKDWNRALSFVDTKLATIVHQDDIYLPIYGSEMIDYFNSNKSLNIVFSDYEECDSKSIPRQRNINLKIKRFFLKIMSLSNNKFYQRRIYALGNFICCPAVTYNMERLKDFRFNENLKMTLDWDAWERIMNIPGNIAFIDKKLMFHRIHEGSETTVNTKNKLREEEECMMYKRYWGKSIAKFLMKFYVLNQRTNR